ncbi:MAG: hypothetical protein KQ78_00206 [Candidatus Izimaplasma bacterium HR2]|nr:MAG: hypothetical protein KQ78_00206 [Candidatus Izimaplasma bacterium HR2]
MEQTKVDEVKNRIASALENIEKLDQEAISFAAGKVELVKTSEELRNLLKDIDVLTKEISELVARVSSVTVEDTLKRFDENVSKIENKVISLGESNSKVVEVTNSVIADLKKTFNRNFTIFSAITIILFITSIVLNVLL